MADDHTEKPTDNVEVKQDAPIAAKPATGFGSFASAQSPFASAAASNGGASPNQESSTKDDSAKTEPKNDTPSASGFAAFASTKSPFANAAPAAKNTDDTTGASGFAAFASVKSPFASAAPKAEPASTVPEDSATKESQAEEPEAKSAPAFGTSKPTSGLQLEEHEYETGEENESTVFACHGSLFVFDESQWKGRGEGTFKINVREDEAAGSKKTARFLMRSDGVFRLLLNSPLLPDMTCQNPKNTTRVMFMAADDSKLKPFTLRLSGKHVDAAAELHQKILELQKETTK